MPKKLPSPSAEIDAARAAARNTDSGAATAAPPAAGKGDLPAQKAIDTQALASGMPANPKSAPNKAGPTRRRRPPAPT